MITDELAVFVSTVLTQADIAQFEHDAESGDESAKPVFEVFGDSAILPIKSAGSDVFDRCSFAKWPNTD